MEKLFIFGGETTLVKPTMPNLLIYLMSIFKMPNAMGERLDHIKRNFLWKGQGDKEKDLFSKMELVD